MADSEYTSNDANDKVTVKTWRAWRTIHEMVQDRGYELSDTEVNMTLETFKNIYCNFDGSVVRSKLKFSARPSPEMIRKMTPIATPSNPDPKADVGTIWVEFLDEEQLGADQMRRFGKFCAHENHHTGILVSHVSVSPSAKKEIAKFAQWTSIEWFLEEDLLINITHHELVPRHVVLSREEKVALLKRYRLKETQLPRILQKDPVAKYYGMKRGQVVKIIRSSETAGRYASYRLCV
ncbi:DNA-directed RNA polymerases II 24 kDa polypeptide [Annulohypoxylon maeteangense]|uniref:DNA-directed RNA polymerases II 24 kDa polypeptide n=1 Tax=Annulohypoxylon maeteangense TaxID=1927788 RepID=UPI002007A2AE|nr:DNA-directed RNA polymerases II 24 kDa polypeptide [Annulohypoxylon maeteangense]KAI0888882.1 DNA-directed RNA polymerases II 24 kDa polypeptide [Annulohypoxylon maeteangense]